MENNKCLEAQLSPLNDIEECIKQLENINLSPIPSTQNLKKQQKSEIAQIIKKLVYYLDMILVNNLKSFSSSNLKGMDDVHYWNYISKYFHIPSVKFINNICDRIETNTDKGLAWLVISMTEKSLHESIREIYKQSFDVKFYKYNSLIIEKKLEILALTNRLSALHYYEIDLELIKEYNEYKNIQEKEEKEIDEEMPIMSPADSKRNDKTILITPFHLNLNSKTGNNNITLLLSRGYENYSNFQSKISLEGGKDKSTYTIDNLFNLMNDDDEEFYPEEDDSENIIKEKAYAKNTQIIYNNIKNLEENRILTNLKNNDEKNDQCSVYKFIDINNCIKEDYYNFKNKQVITNCIDNMDKFIPIDKNFRIHVLVDKNKYTIKDKISYKNKKINMRNSIVYYLNNYYKKELFYKFNTNITDKPNTLRSQNYQCQFCLKDFKRLACLVIDKTYWCSYYMKYICKECLSDEYSIIPGFVIKKWDFKKFTVSIQAKKLLNEWYEKPIIYIKPDDHINKYSSSFRHINIIKQKINIIFDIMKCDKLIEFAESVLGDYKYLVLRHYLYSLKDLVDINEGRFGSILMNFYRKFEDHILKNCSVCAYKGGICVICLKDEYIRAYEIENVFYCYDCKKIFHKKCCIYHACIIKK